MTNIAWNKKFQWLDVVLCQRHQMAKLSGGARLTVSLLQCSPCAQQPRPDVIRQTMNEMHPGELSWQSKAGLSFPDGYKRLWSIQMYLLGETCHTIQDEALLAIPF